MLELALKGRTRPPLSGRDRSQPSKADTLMAHGRTFLSGSSRLFPRRTLPARLISTGLPTAARVFPAHRVMPRHYTAETSELANR